MPIYHLLLDLSIPQDRIMIFPIVCFWSCVCFDHLNVLDKMKRHVDSCMQETRCIMWWLDSSLLILEIETFVPSQDRPNWQFLTCDEKKSCSISSDLAYACWCIDFNSLVFLLTCSESQWVSCACMKLMTLIVQLLVDVFRVAVSFMFLYEVDDFNLFNFFVI